MTNSLGFVFPGQGSQAVGMLGELAEQHAVIKETFGEASDALGYDLWALSQNGPEADLNRTDRTQPAILTASVALWRLWCQTSAVRPAFVAGHSLGEYSALVAAGVLSFADAVRLVERRGQLMQQAVPEGKGAMAAILGLEDEQIIELCAAASQGQVVSAVNFNAPGQVVIAGEADAVARAIDACKNAGAKRAIALPVSVPSHCALMQPAAEQLSSDFAALDWQAPSITLVQNVTAQPAANVADLRQLLVEQLYSPVRWVESVVYMAEQGVTDLAECGPGKVLGGLNKRCAKAINNYSLDSVTGFTAFSEHFA
ncbi:MAG: ACP S-malonyltransferase [Halopseudomonas sp.]|uniref:ACP S-malonyltransferase n=1 Tax=Halopseudomonas sp. TaxID=2901191 RepID=UPI003002CFBF